MYYDTIEEAIKANPHCTHVLTPGPDWCKTPPSEHNPDIAGCYVAAVKNARVFSPLDADGKAIADVTAYIAPTHWQIAATNQRSATL